MKTLAKIIKRLLFGPSLEDYEARQKAENVMMVQRMESTPLIKATVSADERRAAELLAIAKMQSDMQRVMAKSYDVFFDDQYIGKTKNEPLVKY